MSKALSFRNGAQQRGALRLAQAGTPSPHAPAELPALNTALDAPADTTTGKAPSKAPAASTSLLQQSGTRRSFPGKALCELATGSSLRPAYPAPRRPAAARLPPGKLRLALRNKVFPAGGLAPGDCPPAGVSRPCRRDPDPDPIPIPIRAGPGSP